MVALSPNNIICTAPADVAIIEFKENYPLSTYGFLEKHFVYLWFKNSYFTHLKLFLYLPLPTSIKNMGKFVFLLYFYVSLLLKHKIKN